MSVADHTNIIVRRCDLCKFSRTLPTGEEDQSLLVRQLGLALRPGRPGNCLFMLSTLTSQCSTWN